MWFPTIPGPDDQAHLKLAPHLARHADPSIQHSYDAQSLINLSLPQTSTSGEGKNAPRIHPETPAEISLCSRVSKDIHTLESCQDQAMSRPSVSYLRPLRPPPSLPALPLTRLRPLLTQALANMPRPPIFANTSPRSLQDQSQSLIGNSSYRTSEPSG